MPSLAARILASQTPIITGSLTVGSGVFSGKTMYGFSNTAVVMGSVSPAFWKGPLGLVFSGSGGALFSWTSFADLQLNTSVNVNLASAFSVLIMQVPGGSLREFTSASANTSGTAGFQWVWGNGSSMLYQAANVGNTYKFWMMP